MFHTSGRSILALLFLTARIGQAQPVGPEAAAGFFGSLAKSALTLFFAEISDKARLNADVADQHADIPVCDEAAKSADLAVVIRNPRSDSRLIGCHRYFWVPVA